MMIKNKLKSQKGITIIHAIIGILLLAMVSSVIFVSSMANMKAYAKIKRQQQAYLTVSSAVDVFVNSIQGDTISAKVYYHREGTWTENQGTSKFSNPYEITAETKQRDTVTYSDTNLQLPSSIASDIQTKYIAFATGSNTKEISKTYTISCSETTGSGSSAKTSQKGNNVEVEVQYTRNYINANFKVIGADGADVAADDQYYLCVQIPVKYEKPDPTELTVDYEVFTDSTFLRNLYNTISSVEVLGNIYVSYNVKIADWDSIVISKGVLTW